MRTPALTIDFVTLAKCNDSEDDDDDEGRDLGEHEDVLQLRRDLHRVTVQPAMQTDSIS